MIFSVYERLASIVVSDVASSRWFWEVAVRVEGIVLVEVGEAVGVGGERGVG